MTTILDMKTGSKIIDDPSTIEFIIRSRHADLNSQVPIIDGDKQAECDYIQRVVNANYERDQNGLLRKI